MMHYGKYFSVLFILILTGCGGFSGTKVPSIEKIDHWLAKENYGEALELVRQMQNNSPSAEIDNKMSDIKKRADRFDETRSREIYELINNENINEARQLLRESLLLYPTGPRLTAIDSHLKSTQSTQISRLQAQQLLSKSEWLLRSKEIQKSLQMIKPESSETFKDPSLDIEETAAELYHLGLKALQKNDLELADSCLIMSNKLYPRRFTASAIARLELLKEKEKQRIIALEKKEAAQKREEELKENLQTRQVNNKARQQQLASKQREFDALYFDTVTMLKDNQLSLAKNNLDKLNQLMPDNAKLEPLNREFSEKLPAHIEALLDRGRQLYINGKIEKARDIWYKAKKLDPSNEQVNKNIERADRVLGRLHELKKKSPN